jgi:predicted nucleic acid-binding protein
MIRTFIDSGVLLAAARGTEACSETALTILEDQEREFASSMFVRLEVLPKATYFDRKIEVQFYESYFSEVEFWASDLDQLIDNAYGLACQYGLAAIDALHVAAAFAVGAEELITTEKPTNPMHRVENISIVAIMA